MRAEQPPHPAQDAPSHHQRRQREVHGRTTLGERLLVSDLLPSSFPLLPASIGSLIEKCWGFDSPGRRCHCMPHPCQGIRTGYPQHPAPAPWASLRTRFSPPVDRCLATTRRVKHVPMPAACRLNGLWIHSHTSRGGKVQSRNTDCLVPRAAHQGVRSVVGTTVDLKL